jgi:hypothetical protein
VGSIRRTTGPQIRASKAKRFNCRSDEVDILAVASSSSAHMMHVADVLELKRDSHR